LNRKTSELSWRKSSRSVANSACVEFAVNSDQATVFIRDSKDPQSPILAYNQVGWTNFIDDVKDGRFDLP
jgi:hypothetical protein